MPKRTAKKPKSQKEEKITIPPIAFKVVKMTLEGVTPLLVSRFDEKSKTEILEKQTKKARGGKAARDPSAEFKASLYKMPGSRTKFGMPAAGIKNCAVSACRFIDGVPMTIAKGAFQILDDTGGLVEIKGSKPVMDERMVRVGKFGNKVATPRYRGRFDKWAVTFKVKYNSRIMSTEQLVNLYENAGFAVGLCEYRPEKSGNLGMFRVKR